MENNLSQVFTIPDNFFARNFDSSDDETPTNTPKKSSKSKNETTPSSEANSQKSPSYSPVLSNSVMSNNTFQEAIDPNKELSLWNFYSDIENDKCVKEYTDYLNNNGYFPRVPDVNKLNTLPTPSYQLTANCSAKVISIFTDYFQSRYFCKNSKGALDNNYALSSVHVNIQVPQYNQMPMKVFKNVVDQKDSLSLAMQVEYLNGQQFVCELNLLRVFDIIHTEVSAQVNGITEVGDHTNYFFLTHYVATKTNFMKEYRMKIIDWSAKPKKNKMLLPLWRRKEGGSPPKYRENRYALKLIQSVKDGKTALDKTSVLQKFDELEIPSNREANITSEMEEDKEQPTTSKGRGQPEYKTRNFRNLDHRRGEYKTFRRRQGDFGKEYRKEENPLYSKNRERFMNSHEKVKTSNQAGISRNFID